MPLISQEVLTAVSAMTSEDDLLGECMACQGQGSGEGQQPSMLSDEALDKGSDCSSLTASAFRK